MIVGGWFDAEDLYGPLDTYRTIEATSPGAKNMLVMGPWTHGGWARGDGASLGPVSFSAKTSEFFREKIRLPFFEHHLKEKGGGIRPRRGPSRRAATSGTGTTIGLQQQPAEIPLSWC